MKTSRGAFVLCAIGMKLAFKSRVGRMLLSVLALNDVAKGNGVADNRASSSKDQECGVYFAESTIPGAGMGMFAGKDFEKAELITHGDIAIPLVELEWHNAFEDWGFLWDDYVWSKNTVEGMDEEIPGAQIHAASPGIGAALNCMLSLVNLEASAMQLDSAGLHRSRDPGAGSSTPYHDRRGFAIDNIEKGAELFIWYGENYFESRSQEYGMVPLPDNFEQADELLEQFSILLLKLKGSSDKLKEGLWSFITEKFSGADSRTLNALPRTIEEVPKALRVGTAKLPYDKTVRSIEWLKENGVCMDNLRPGNSTIPQAGRGAFATRFLPQGSIVAPAPLIHILNKTRFDMYGILPDDEDGYVSRNTSKVVHKQLLLNYCFTHPQSSLLLSPYGVLTSLINHSSRCPNVKIQWSDIMPHAEWLELPLEELEEVGKHAGLAFDFVALKDINEGEEVLLDYGKEWEDAWNEHVRNWVPPPGSEYYHAAYELNIEDNFPILWPWDEKPYYAPSVDLWVRRYFVERSGMKDLGDYSLFFGRIANRYLVAGEYRYLVERIIQRGENDDDATECYIEVLGVAFDVPRQAFVFEDLPYTRDHQLHSTFRHGMMIPNEMFPEAWKNMK